MAIERLRDEQDPKISVVIPSLPSRSLEGVKRALNSQDFSKPYEIVAVNDSDLDVCEARNKGMKEAKADIIAFTDDDCRPDKDWLSSIYEIFSDDPEVILIEGKVYGGARYTGSRLYMTANIAAKKEKALGIGGFDSSYSGYREDTEFGWRMEKEASGKCIYSSKVAVKHPRVPRSNFIPENERRLKQNYPERFELLLETPKWNIIRFLQRKGLDQPLLAILDALINIKIKIFRGV